MRFDFPTHRSGDTWRGINKITILEGNVPLDLNGCDIYIQFRSIYNLASPVVLLLSTENNTISITNPTSGIISIPQQIINVPVGRYRYDLQVDFPDGVSNTYMYGEWEILPGITTPSFDSTVNSRYNSIKINSLISLVSSNSAMWGYMGTDIKELTANWQNTYTIVQNNSSSWSLNTIIKELSSFWGYEGTDIKELTANWQNTYTIVQNNSSSWAIDALVRSLSGYWQDAYTLTSENSSIWNSVYSLVLDASGNWNSVYNEYNSNSALYTTTDYVNSNFLPLSGGIITGNLTVLSSVELGLDDSVTTLYVTEGTIGINTETPNVELTVNGSISSNSVIYDKNGNSNDWNSVYSSVKDTSGNWDSVYTTYKQNSSTYSTTDYVNSNFLPLSGGIITGNLTVLSSVELGLDDSVTTLYVTEGTIGINTETPNVELTVNGSISSNSVIYDKNGNSNDWNSVYSSVKDTSGNWNSVYSSVKDISGNWDSVYSSVKDTSGNWNSVYSSVLDTSGNWNSVYSSVKDTSGNWDSVYSSVLDTSGNWDSVYSSVLDTSGNWDSVYTTYKQNSSTYSTTDYVNSNFLPLSGGIITGNLTVLSSVELGLDDSVTTLYVTEGTIGINTETPNVELTVNGSISSNSVIYDKNGNSNDWNSVYSSVKDTSGNWNSVYSSVKDTSGNWNSVYSSVKDISGNWDSVYSSVKDTSGNWDSVYTTYKQNSSTYATINFVDNKFLPLSGGTINGNLTIDGDFTILGELSQIDTVISTTSSLEITNAGTTPALKVTQKGNSDIAIFKDDNSTSLIIKDGGNVGIGIDTPNEKLTVNGSISSNNIIYDEIGNSKKWNYAYTSVENTSGILDSVFTTVSQNSSVNWSRDAEYAELKSLSSTWISTHTTVSQNSAEWLSDFSVTQEFFDDFLTLGAASTLPNAFLKPANIGGAIFVGPENSKQGVLILSTNTLILENQRSGVTSNSTIHFGEGTEYRLIFSARKGINSFNSTISGRIDMGFHNQISTNNEYPAYGCFFTSENGENWKAVSILEPLVAEITNTNIPCDENWRTFEIRVNQDASVALFYINDNLIATHTQSIPKGTNTQTAIGYRCFRKTATDLNVELRIDWQSLIMKRNNQLWK